MKENIKRKLNIVGILFAILFFISVILFVVSHNQTSFDMLYPTHGELIVSDVDFSNEVFAVATDWDYYPEKLYFPSDFENGTTDEPKSIDEVTNRESMRYGTYRLVIKAVAEEYLSLCGYGIDYSTRVFVNGKDVQDIGNVSDNKKTSVPQVGYMTIPIYTGKTGEVELIMQFSNFVHNEGGVLFNFCLSTPENIEQYKTGYALTSYFFGGALLFISLYFLFNAIIQKKKEYLCLAICSLIAALRNQYFFIFGLLPQTASFEIKYRLTVLVVALLPAAILSLLTSLYPPQKKKDRIIFYSYLSVIAVMTVFLFVLSTFNLVKLSVLMYVVSAPYLVYMIYRIIKYYKNKKTFDKTDALTVGGFSALLISLMCEAFMTGSIVTVTRDGIVYVGMLLFILAISAAVGIKIRQDEAALADSKRKRILLQEVNVMNKDFLYNVAHELKTPLTVMSGYAQLTQMQYQNNKMTSETTRYLQTIQSEAKRLGDIVSSLSDYSMGKTSDVIFDTIPIRELLQNVCAICQPICDKRDIALTVKQEEGISVYGNRDMLIQVFVNLIVNAVKHTDHSVITITVQKTENCSKLRFEVKDTGSGISQELTSHIFEKGISGDGSSGLGLFICKKAIELHRGVIWLDKSDSNGTTFAFELPISSINIIL